MRPYALRLALESVVIKCRIDAESRTTSARPSRYSHGRAWVPTQRAALVCRANAMHVTSATGLRNSYTKKHRLEGTDTDNERDKVGSIF